MLEVEFATKLNFPRIVRGIYLPVGAIVRVIANPREVGVVERIEKLAAELEASFVPQADIFNRRQVP